MLAHSGWELQSKCGTIWGICSCGGLGQECCIGQATAAEMTSGQPRAAWLHCSSHQTPVLCRCLWNGLPQGMGTCCPSLWMAILTASSMFLLELCNLTSGPVLSHCSQAHRMGNVVALLCGLFIRWSQVVHVLLPLKCNSLQRILACRQGLPH